MELLSWMGGTFARFVGLVVMILGGWTFLGNAVGSDFEGWVLAWVLVSGLFGAIGGALYLLSWDGPKRLRAQATRMWGWALMVAASILPTSLTLMIFPIVLFVCPLLPYARVNYE